MNNTLDWAADWVVFMITNLEGFCLGLVLFIVLVCTVWRMATLTLDLVTGD